LKINTNDFQDNLVEKFSKICDKKISLCSMMPGVAETLKALRDYRINMHISSATPEKSLLHILKKRNIHHYFSKMLGAPSSKISHIAGIKKFYKAEVSDILYVGDSLIDKVSAEKSGVKFISFKTNFKKTKVITDMTEILDIVNDE